MRLATKAAALTTVCALGVLTACSAPSPTVSTAPAGTSAAVPSEPAYAAAVQEKITAAMTANVIPGAVLRISSPTQGEWTGTFGTGTIGRNDPLSVDDHFRAGSITKTMTSTVILQLVQEGKLTLDDNIGKFRRGVPNGDRITIAQLAEMRSGLYSYCLLYTSDAADDSLRVDLAAHAAAADERVVGCLLYTSPSPRDRS